MNPQSPENTSPLTDAPEPESIGIDPIGSLSADLAIGRVLSAAGLVIDDEVLEAVAGLDLVDHHCHGVTLDQLTEEGFTSLLGESSLPPPAGCSAWDAALGISVRALCGPVLGFDGMPSGAEYARRRDELGGHQSAQRLLRNPVSARGMLIDTGYKGDEILGVEDMAELSSADTREIVRLETLAEAVARQGASANTFAETMAAAVADENRSAVGWKSIAAYRGGLNIDWSRPSPSAVREAAGEWLASGTAETLRMNHPVLMAHGVWCAVDTAKVIQFHTGFGDTDAALRSSDPALLSDLAEMTAPSGASISLLHTWPRHREAAYLAGMWPHVYCDVGEAIPHLGLAGIRVLAEALELAPWHKVLYSSDAFGLAELHYLGALISRAALAAALNSQFLLGLSIEEITRLGRLFCADNAIRAYRLEAHRS